MDTVEKYKKYVNTAFVKAVEPVVVVSASGAKVTAEDGKVYTDLFAGISFGVEVAHLRKKVEGYGAGEFAAPDARHRAFFKVRF